MKTLKKYGLISLAASALTVGSMTHAAKLHNGIDTNSTFYVVALQDEFTAEEDKAIKSSLKTWNDVSDQQFKLSYVEIESDDRSFQEFFQQYTLSNSLLNLIKNADTPTFLNSLATFSGRMMEALPSRVNICFIIKGDRGKHPYSMVTITNSNIDSDVKVTKAIIDVNTVRPFGKTYNDNDFEGTMTHEIGHLLGLHELDRSEDESTVEEFKNLSTMDNKTAHGTAFRRTLSLFELNELNDLYDLNEESELPAYYNQPLVANIVDEDRKQTLDDEFLEKFIAEDARSLQNSNITNNSFFSEQEIENIKKDIAIIETLNNDENALPLTEANGINFSVSSEYSKEYTLAKIVFDANEINSEDVDAVFMFSTGNEGLQRFSKPSLDENTFSQEVLFDLSSEDYYKFKIVSGNTVYYTDWYEIKAEPVVPE